MTEDYEGWTQEDLRNFYITLGESVLKDTDNNPIKFYDYQKKFMRDTSRFIIVLKSRQTGFSYITTWLKFCQALFEKKDKYLISTNERASKNLVRYVDWFIHCMSEKFIYKIGGGFKSRSTEKVEFIKGGSLHSLPNSARAGRGFHGDLVFDEFAFFENAEDIWTSVLPVLTRGYGLTMISTPNGKKGKYYEVWTGGISGEYEKYSRHKVHYKECKDIVEHISDLRRSMSIIQFKQEYCCTFVDEATSVFPYELLKPCVDIELCNDIGYFSGNKLRQVVVGIDFGKVNDSTVLIALEKMNNGLLVMRYMKEYTGDYNKQLHDGMGIVKILSLLKPSQVLVDATGVGEKLFEDLRSVYGSKIRPVKFTNVGKERMVADLHIALEDKNIRLMNDDKLITQLHDMERKKISGSHRVRFEHPKGKHDDYCWSLMLAVNGLFRKSISFSVVSR